MKSNGVCPWCLAVQVHYRCSIWGHRPNSFCVVRHEVRTDHLNDRELHCVVLHSNPWVVTSQGNSREFVAWSVCNRVQGGQTVTYGCFLGVPFFLVTPLPNRETQHVNIVLQCICQFFNRQIWKEIMLELNGKPSNVTTSLTDFPFQNLVFWNLFEFSAARITLKSIFPHPKSRPYQINSIKSCSSRSFVQHQTHIPIPFKISAMI